MAKQEAKKRPITTAVTEYLTANSIPYAIHRFDDTEDTQGFGLSTARALAVEPERVFVAELVDVDGQTITIVSPANKDVNYPAVAAAVGAKNAVGIDGAKVEKETGFSAYSLSPIAQKRHLPTLVDVSALDFPTVYVSGGKAGLDIELSPDDLVATTQARTAPITVR